MFGNASLTLTSFHRLSKQDHPCPSKIGDYLSRARSCQELRVKPRRLAARQEVTASVTATAVPSR